MTTITQRLTRKYLPGMLDAQDANGQADTDAGLRLAEIECSWGDAEAAEGNISASYLSGRAALAAEYKQSGYQVAVSAGVFDPPSWLASACGADWQYKDQFGGVSGTPNFVWNPAIRSAAGTYIAALTTAMSQQLEVDYYRIGLSPSGEMFLPYTSSNQWWAWDSLAQGDGSGLPAGVGPNPAPGWIPGTATYGGQPVTIDDAVQWWYWYEGASNNAHRWRWQPTGRAAGMARPCW